MMSDHGKVPDSLELYRCEDCGEKFRSHANLVRCPECTSDNVEVR